MKQKLNLFRDEWQMTKEMIHSLQFQKRLSLCFYFDGAHFEIYYIIKIVDIIDNFFKRLLCDKMSLMSLIHI